MKTQAVRLDDVTIGLIEDLAKRRHARASDIIRTAIRDHLAQSAIDDAGFKEFREEVRRDETERHNRELAERIGADVDAIATPTDR